MKKLIFIALACLLVAYVIRDGGTYLHQLKWKSANISHYRFQLSIQCFCMFYLNHMPVTVEVQDGEIVSIIDSSGTVIPSENENYKDISRFATVDRLFSTLRANLGSRADEFTVTYDFRYGFPTEIRIDRSKNIADDEWALNVSGFVALP